MAEAAEMFMKNHAAVAALIVLILIVLAAIFGPVLYLQTRLIWFGHLFAHGRRRVFAGH